MDLNMVVPILSQFGFPIFCCIYLFWHDNKTNEQHKEEVSKLTEIVQNNTIALVKLTDKIENMESKVGK